MKAILPICTAHQPYDKITIAVVPASDGETCSFGDYNDYVDEMMETGGHMMHLHKANGTTIEETLINSCRRVDRPSQTRGSTLVDAWVNPRRRVHQLS